MWVLYLNPMRANAEACVSLAWADSKEALEKFVASEKVEPYRDGQWHKVFRRGGPLEEYNPPEQTWNDSGYRYMGTLEDAIAGITNDWNQFRARTMKV